MDNRLNLDEYLYGFHDEDDKREIFYLISLKMHKYHNDGYFLKNLSFKTVSLCFTNLSDVRFSYYDRFDKASMSDMIDYRMNNIVMFAILMMSVLVDSSNNMMILNIDVIKNNFDSFKALLNENDFNYLRRVLIDGDYLYYDDYIKSLNNVSLDYFRGDEGAFVSCFLLTVNLVVVILIFSCILLYVS